MQDKIKLDKLHLLVVDDLVPMRDLMVQVFRKMGVGDISYALNGAEAYEEYLRKKPDIIITDWFMPEMDGIELTKKIRTSKQSHNPAIPILMMSGFSAVDRIGEARDGGVTEFIIKPFSAEDMAKRLAYIIKNPRDLIIADNFIGPDRRRRQKDNIKEEKRSEESQKSVRRIPADTSLQEKTGVGKINELDVQRAHEIIERNEINFLPIIHGFLEQLEEELEKGRTQDIPQKQLIQNITMPVMQIKANGKIFHYDLIGDLAEIVLNLLESLAALDDGALQIVQAFVTTLRRVLKEKVTGSGGKAGDAFRKEMKGACDRFARIRAHNLKENMRKQIESA